MGNPVITRRRSIPHAPPRPLRWLVTFVLVTTLNPHAARGEGAGWQNNVDMALRYENESGSRVGRPDRERTRLKLKAAWSKAVGDNHTFELGFRVGRLDDQKVPTATIVQLDAANDSGPRDVYVDVWNWRYRNNGWSAQIGRMRWPMFTSPNIDSDINGYGISVERAASGAPWTTRLAAMTMPDGGLHRHGRLVALEQVYNHGGWQVGAGYWSFDGKRGARYLRDSDLDYRILMIRARYRGAWQRGAEGTPYELGVTAFENLEDYRLALDDPRAPFVNRTSGWQLTASIGRNRRAGDLRFRYGYLHVDRLASIRDFAQNALARYGTTDLAGHDFRLTLSISERWTVTARASLTREIVGPERGRRYRIDFARRF